MDPEYVEGFKSQLRLESLGLFHSSPIQASPRPRVQLPSTWHRLLESCLELTFQLSILRVSANLMTAEANRRIPREESGQAMAYHFRSWFIHAEALAECAIEVVKWTSEVYVTDPSKRLDLCKRKRLLIKQQISDRVAKQRNSYVHTSRRSWASGLTEGELWEGFVSSDLTPQKFLKEVRWPEEGNRMASGRYGWFVVLTEDICSSLTSILEGLEKDICQRR